jgi:hypothetical protein
MGTYLLRAPLGSQPQGETALERYLRDVVELGQRVADALQAENP